VQGRFTGADPLVGVVWRPQSWNKYAYVLNNPLKYQDPNGLRWARRKDDDGSYTYHWFSDTVDVDGNTEYLLKIDGGGWEAVPFDEHGLFMGITYQGTFGDGTITFDEYSNVPTYGFKSNNPMVPDDVAQEYEIFWTSGSVLSRYLLSDSGSPNAAPIDPPVPGGSGESGNANSSQPKPPGSPPGNLLKLAKKYRLNANSETSKQVLENVNTTCEEFINNFRKASIKSEFPTELMNKTVGEALGDSTARKLLISLEYAK
jgi:hypothetical protein